MRAGNDAVAWARSNMRWPAGYCLQWTRNCFDVDPLYHDASDAWYGARHKHPTERGANCPRGVPVWWTGGSQGFGHVALSVGGGYCISTDAGGRGICAKVRIDDLTRRWGLNFRGWSEDINGVRVYEVIVDKPAPGWDKVNLGALDRGESNLDIERVKWALRRKVGKGGMDFDRYKQHWGAAVTEQYKAWQRRLGFTGNDADGRPGPYSLRKLDLQVMDA
jgi:hypothetical protein